MSGLIRKAFLSVDGRDVHYRTAGAGPPVVLMHDSPRSSALNIPLIEALAADFTVIALDTPGNGASSPLAGAGPFGIADFSEALARTLEAMGIRRAGFYGVHTSSKILLEFATRFPERVSVAIMDGLSVPEGGAAPEFVTAYMRPFVIEEDGSHLAREWTRQRDSGRWFPWFSRDPAHRIAPIRPPDPLLLHQAFLDYVSAGPHYSDVYAAAMFYQARPKLMALTTPTVIMARSDDVLYSQLDGLPPGLPSCCSVERLTPDRESWKARVCAIFRAGGPGAPTPQPRRLATTPAEGVISGYVNLSHGQLRYRRFGEGSGRPVVYLPELPGGAGANTVLLQALAAGRPVFALDPPACGLSDPLPKPSLTAYVSALAEAVAALADGPVDLVAETTATPLALKLVVRRPQAFRRLVLDGVLLADDAERQELARSICPPLAFEMSGAHLHRLWQMLRDQACQWPWYDGSSRAVRRSAPAPDAVKLHHRFLDVLAHMADYRAPVLAALEEDARPALAALPIPTLVTSQVGDPRFDDAQHAAGLSPRVGIAERPCGDEARGVLFREFFDRP